MDARLEHGPRPAGADNTTMLLWHAINDAGDAGITRDELVVVVGPRVNVGHARRRYLAQRLIQQRRIALGDGPSQRYRPATFENTDPVRAIRYFISNTLKNMRHDGSVRRDEQDRYQALRKPRAARYQEDDAVLDPSGMGTRLHMNTNETLRVLKPALERHRASYRAQLDSREWRALERLVELAEEELRAGFPTWLPSSNGEPAHAA